MVESTNFKKEQRFSILEKHGLRQFFPKNFKG